MERIMLNPVWDNGDARDRIRVTFQYTYDDGTTQEAPAVISADSPDWEEVLKITSFEELDAKWQQHLDTRKDRESKREEEKKRQEERMKQEALFALKLEIFEIDDIKNSKNRKLKSKVRRAKTQTEAILYAGVLINREFTEE